MNHSVHNFLQKWKSFLIGLGMVILVAILAVATFGGIRKPAQPISKEEGKRVIQAATPILVAIRAYIQQTGHPPARLESLVPQFLPTIPTPPSNVASGHDYLYSIEPIQWRLGVPLRGERDGILTYSSIGDYSFVRNKSDVQQIGAWAYYSSASR